MIGLQLAQILSAALLLSTQVSTMSMMSPQEAHAQMIPSREYTIQVAPIVLPHKLVDICNAESGLRQFDSDGKALRGKANPQDIGFCQINLKWWGAKAKELGYDLFTENGNKLMAIWIYNNYGTEPWKYSKSMWDK